MNTTIMAANGWMLLFLCKSAATLSKRFWIISRNFMKIKTVRLTMAAMIILIFTGPKMIAAIKFICVLTIIPLMRVLNFSEVFQDRAWSPVQKKFPIT